MELIIILIAAVFIIGVIIYTLKQQRYREPGEAA